jgi:NADH-quinone oxidoreductase subunit C
LSSADTESADTESADAETADAEAEGADDHRAALLGEITELLGDAVVESHIDPGHETYIRLAPSEWKPAHRLLRDELGFKFFEFLSAIDWMPSPYGKSEDATVDAGVLVTTVEDAGEIEHGHAGGESRFQVFTRLMNIFEGRSHGSTASVVVKTDVTDPREDDGDQLASLIEVFPGANWHEREIHEMFGIRFAGHPYLANLYLPSGFEGNPLRKDFPLLARQVKPWPGIVDVEPMPDEADTPGDADDEIAEGGDAS